MPDILTRECSTGQLVEKDYTEEEKQAIEDQRLKDLLNPTVVTEPIDSEKVAMAEAIIDMNTRITELENKLNGGI